MKTYISALTLSIALVACGGGSGGGKKASNTISSNALSSFAAMSSSIASSANEISSVANSSSSLVVSSNSSANSQSSSSNSSSSSQSSSQSSSSTTSSSDPDPVWTTPELVETDTVAAGFPRIAMNANGDAMVAWMRNFTVFPTSWGNSYSPALGWGTASLLQADATKNGRMQTVAIDDSGFGLAVWLNGDLGPTEVFANSLDSGWGTAAAINGTTGTFANFSHIAMKGHRTAFAVWSEQSSGRNHIWANRYVAGWSTAQEIETLGTGAASRPKVGMDTSGNALVVWEQFTSASDLTSNVWAAVYSTANGWGAPVQIESDANAAEEPQVAMNALGEAVAIWRQTDGSHWNLWANHYTLSQGWGTPVLIETINTGDVSSHSVSIDSSGNAIAIWEQSDGMHTNVMINSFSSTNSSWSGTTILDSFADGDATAPRVAMNDGGDAVAVWQQEGEVWARVYVAGDTWLDPQRLNTLNQTSQYPDVGIAADGTAIAVWSGLGSGEYSIWASRLEK